MTFGSSPRVVLTYGRFDLMHDGHVRFLRQLAALGSELIVGCATDAHAKAIGRPCRMPHATRRMRLEDCAHVSRVIPWDCVAQTRTDIVNYNVCTLAIADPNGRQLDDLQDIVQVLYLPPVGAAERPSEYPHRIAS